MDLQYCHQSLLMKRHRQKGCSDIPFAVNRRNPIKQEIVKINLQKPSMTGLEAEAIF